MSNLVKHILIAVLILPLLAFAAPKVVLDLKAEIEVIVEENGVMVTKRIPAVEVEVGKDVFYTLTYINDGDELAKNIEVKNKIPKDTIYLLDSAWGEGADIQFSVDNGETFKKPSLLYYEVKGEDGKVVKKTITPEKYTDVLWVIKEVAAGKSGTVGFNVKVN
jgi:uncharacterized repeat protein (TIGR01451 family)